ncbi:ArnT family glycosyltransferase [Aureispira anguillae]|uniref:Glycosyltransferase family 39 protein n=1 Tax=Aureispira anguillae TaxID=2864201 RepID=A0A915YF36_9BACT|nr:glycosyltransferase family 39 protein [Aureispira anguillae]BDS11963.1 glycosyltransferase family 39 protein [Aureispira anguillae]
MKKSTQFVWLIGIVFVVNLLWMNHSVTLWDEDEAAYAGFAIEMLNSGDWVNPEYQWSVIHRKTPFHFWSIAISYQIFGVNEFAVRMPSVLAILLTCLMVFRMGRTLVGDKNAGRAAVILATSVQLPLMGKIALTDASLLLFETVAVLSLLNFLNRPSWKWNLGLWLSIALGILVKGPPIILLVGGLWILLAIFHPKRKQLIRTHPWFFGWLAIAPFALWCYLSYLQDWALWQETGNGIPFAEWWQEEANGHKIHLLPFLWEWYVLRRIGGSVLGQSGFIGYHFVVLSIAFLTWLPFWLLTLKSTLKSFVRPSEQQLTLLLWVVMGWFFWEFMSSKLPSYSMGAQPALALLMALQIEQLEKEPANRSLVNVGLGLYALIFGLVIIGLPILGQYFVGNSALGYLLPMSFVLLVLLIRLLQKRTGINQLYQHIAIFGAAFMFLLWACVSPLVEQSAIKSFDEVIETAYELSGKNEEARLILTEFDIKQLKISLLVYAQQRFGAHEEMYLSEAIAAFQEEQPTVLVIGKKHIQEFRAAFAKAKLPFNATEVLHRSTDDQLKEHNFWVISNVAERK